MYKGKNVALIDANNLDDLIVKGIIYIKQYGIRFRSAAGTGLVVYSMNYVLNDSRQRIHNIRSPQAIQYLCRELIAYFKGSLNIYDGLFQASSYWKIMADKSGRINSNYGYYVFHEMSHGKTQYEWVLSHLVRSRETRQAVININQIYHKNLELRDFPCTISIQFLVREGHLCCEVMSRSCDIVYGLPYDLGFFSFLNELVCADLNNRIEENLAVGYTMLRCSFTQIYDNTAEKASDVVRIASSQKVCPVIMPLIDEPVIVLKDIYHGTKKSIVVNWIYKNASFSNGVGGYHD